MKAVIGGVIGGIIVLAVIILFPTQIDTFQEVIEKQTMHPCQKLALENLAIISGEINLLDIPDDGWKEYYEKLDQETAKRYQLFIDSGCMDPDTRELKGDWYNEEFIKKMLDLYKR